MAIQKKKNSGLKTVLAPALREIENSVTDWICLRSQKGYIAVASKALCNASVIGCTGQAL